MTEESPTPTKIIRVAAIGSPALVGASIAGTIRQYGRATVQAIGAAAVNQAVKAVIVAGHYLERDGVQIAMLPAFETVEMDGESRTAIRLEVIKIGETS